MSPAPDTHPIGASAPVLWIGALAVGVGGLVLSGWALDIGPLKSVLPGWVAMKPNTAVAFVLTGLALLVSRYSRFFAVFAGLIGLLSLSEYAFDWNPGFDQWLFPEPPGAVGTSHPGRMAPDTAVCFMLFAVGWEFARRPHPTDRTRLATLVLGAAIVIAALVEMFSYFTPTLRTYGWGGLTMMALPTAAVFAALGVALILTARPTHSRESVLPATDRDTSGARASWQFLLVFLLLTMGIVSAGLFTYRHNERQFRTEAEEQLVSILNLKVGELVQYRKERLGDAAYIADNPAFTPLVRRFLSTPADPDAQRPLAGWLGKYEEYFPYDRVDLLDAQGVTRLSIPPGVAPVASVIAQSTSEVLRSGQVRFQDFYRDDSDRRIYLALLVPIFDDTGGRPPLGMVVLRIDPTNYLYPFISRWPVPSETAETLLVRHDGNEVLFLNELRFQENAALTLRLPLTSTETPAVMAALGTEGIMEGRDYRGARVLAAVGAVPDSPWHLVARQDFNEVFAPLSAKLWQVVLMTGLLLFGAGTGVGLIWRQQRVGFYRARARAAEVLQKNQSLLSQAEELGRVGAWEFDMDTGQLTWSKMVYEIHELDGTGWPTVNQAINYYTPESLPIIEHAVQRAIEQGEPFDLKLEIITAKGNRRSVHTAGRADRARRIVSGFFQDITAQTQAAAALQVEKQNLDALFECSPVALLVLDDTTAIVKVNLAALALTGGSESEFVKHRPGNALRCVHSATDPRGCGYGKGCPLCPARNGIEALIASGGSMHGAEIPLELIRNGAPERVYFRIGAEPVMLNGVRHLLVAMDDVTDRKQVANRLLQFNAELEQRVAERTTELASTNRELEAFSYSVSHDLRAPLRSIDGFSRIVQEDYAARLDDEGRDHLARIRAAAQRMGQLIDALLDLSRVSRAELRRERVDLSTMARDVVAELREREPDRVVEVIVTDGLTAEGDPRLLRVVLQNLIGNAWKFTSKRTDARIEFGATDQDAHTAWFVRDNGAGFEAAYAAKLFGAFQRLHGSDEFPGTGIGLATVMRIVRRHGGHVWAEGVVDHGATFWFALSTPAESQRTQT